jgi:putative heme-binding domain-containing protein
LLGLVGVGLAAARALAADPFAENVRSTPWLAPAEEQRTFRLPPGFAIHLFAAEPDILKPMNLAFDARGRLWVSVTQEYPFPAPPDRPGRDAIKILEDTDGDGRADRISTFADGLNIPIGLYPFRSATGARETWKCIAWSIPNIWLFEDTDGDGRADKRDVLYGPFDCSRDTHGNQASFRRGFDGWLYATHGFNNDSHVQGRDGHPVHLNSGNTYRVRLDGARIEHHTWGQVNPFGLAWDAAGNLYSSDCHSAPTYQLLAGGYYPSFGKPHDGLGFAPVLMEHSHGSTAIDAMFYYADDLWPAEFRDNIFVGNVMTSRVNRDRLVFHGSSPQAIELDDFVKTDDPWFRPVDQCLGPDGALYVADFYNRIIGHYEVPLDHPGRDRTSGRIWRIVYTGNPLRPRSLPEDLDGLVAELASPNLTRRMLAMNEITDRFGAAAIDAVRRALAQPANAFQHVHALWVLHRLAPPGPQPRAVSAHLRTAAASPSALVRVHAQRVAADTLYQAAALGVVVHRDDVEAARQVTWQGLEDDDALVQRCAAEALSFVGGVGTARALLELLARVPPADTHLRYAVRKSLRDLLRDEATFAEVAATQWSQPDVLALAGVALAVRSETAGAFLLQHLPELEADRPLLRTALEHAAQFAPGDRLEAIATFAPEKFADDVDFQLALFAGVEQGAARRGASLTDPLRDWGTTLCRAAMESGGTAGWWNAPLADASEVTNPWVFQERRCEDGQDARLLSSHPLGERLTGRLRSKPFSLPPRLRFYLCGHDGEPGRAPNHRNVIRLRHARTGEVLAEAAPPRSDTARQVVWDLSAHAGEPGVFEATDGDSGDAWAWLAFGRLDPPVILWPSLAPGEAARRQQTALELIARHRLPLGESLRGLLHQPELDETVRAAIAMTSAKLDPAHAGSLLTPFLSADHPLPIRQRAGETLAELSRDPQALTPLIEAMKTAPQRLQLAWAQNLAASAASADRLLQAASDGQLPPRLFQDRRLRDQLLAVRPADAAGRLDQLTRRLPAPDAERERLLHRRAEAFATAKTDPARGARLFQQHCAPCHRIGAEGAVIGPQLDGIGQRGLERLLEDVLDPNRAVDPAFHTTVLTLKDGEVVSGLFRREEGELLVLANPAGQEFTVPKREVAARQTRDTSLMPENFGDLLSEPEFNDLLAFLLAQRTGENAP